MKYMVMECHLSYAVVLDEAGQFLKVANRRYEVGQTVTDVVELQMPRELPGKKKTNRWIYSLAAVAACLVLTVTSVFRMGQMTYASVYMSINPEVRIDVNRRDVVVGLAGVNDDGDDLITGYDHRKKELDLVMDELVDRAIDMGYLHEGGRISLVLDADSEDWIVAHGDTLTVQLNEHLKEKMTVTVEVTDKREQSSQVMIPVSPEESDYGETDYSETDYGESDYGEEIPVSPQPEDGDSDYGDSGYDDGQTDYGEPDDGLSDYDGDDGQTEAQSDCDESDEWEDASDYDSDDSWSDYGETEEPDEDQDDEENSDEEEWDESDDDGEDDGSDYESDDD